MKRRSYFRVRKREQIMCFLSNHEAVCMLDVDSLSTLFLFSCQWILIVSQRLIEYSDDCIIL